MIPGPERDFGIALSGGGVRAAAFALGGLLYLVDSSLNKRVGIISSVSGASLTNGFVLSRLKDFGHVDPDTFDPVARDLVHRLLFAPVMSAAIFAMAGSLVLSGVLIGLSFLFWPEAVRPWLLILAVLGWGALFLLRGIPIEWSIRSRYFGKAPSESFQTTLGESRPLGSTAHVFCATDLVTRSTFFFVDYSGLGCAAHSAFGWALARDVGIATAVRASSAMPGAFPPRALSTKQLIFADWPSGTGRPPRWLHLSDGGVWDNLGTQCFDAQAGVQWTKWKDLANVAPEKVSGCTPPCNIRNLIVLDARGWGPGFTMRGARLRSLLFRVPVVSEFLSLAASSSLQYANTVEPRVDAMMGALGVQIANGKESGEMRISVGVLTDYAFSRASAVAWMLLPEAIRDELREENDYDLWMKKPSVAELPEHLRAVVDYSARIAAAEEQQLSAAAPTWLADDNNTPTEIGNLWRRCASVGTKLSALSRADALALLIHGYIQAMGAAAVLAHTEPGRSQLLPIHFPGVERFERLLQTPQRS